MEQTKALNALEPFLALSKSAISPRAAADLVQRATAAPNTYIFAELLQTPQIQALASSPDFAPHLSLLRIFSHGDYAAYESTPNLPPLDDAQRLKLRQLTLLSLASSSSSSAITNPASKTTITTTTTETTTATTTTTTTAAAAKVLGDSDPDSRHDHHHHHHHHNLSYDRLRRSLRLDSVQQLETLVTTAIYAGLIDARLDPARQRVQVTRVAPLRDLAPGDVADMRDALGAWSARCTAALRDIEAHIEQVHAAARTRTRAECESSDRLVKAMTMAEMRDPIKSGSIGAGAVVGGVYAVGNSSAREQLARRGGEANKRSSTDTAAKNQLDEIDELDGYLAGEDGNKRTAKRKL